MSFVRADRLNRIDGLATWCGRLASRLYTYTPNNALYSYGHIKKFLTCQSPLWPPWVAMISDGRTISELKQGEVAFGIISTDRMCLARRNEVPCYLLDRRHMVKGSRNRGSRVAELICPTALICALI